jgi:hypothetical protein
MFSRLESYQAKGIYLDRQLRLESLFQRGERVAIPEIVD